MRKGWVPAQRRMTGAAPAASNGGRRRQQGGKGAKGVQRGRPAGANGSAPAVTDPELEARRERLSAQFAELQWDLGGMAYEMASRDHYRLDVLNKQAAKLQEVDAELGQVEHILKLEESGATGACPACGALHARGAVFCWQCGKELKPPTRAGAA